MDIILLVIFLILMSSKIHTVEQAREFLKQQALNEICSVSDYHKFLADDGGAHGKSILPKVKIDTVKTTQSFIILLINSLIPFEK